MHRRQDTRRARRTGAAFLTGFLGMTLAIAPASAAEPIVTGPDSSQSPYTPGSVD